MRAAGLMFFERRICLQNAPRDFCANAIGVAFVDHLAAKIAVNLAKLFTIQTQIIGRSRFARAACAQDNQEKQGAGTQRG